MGMNTNNDSVVVVISGAIGAAITALMQRFANARKEKAESKKINIEGRVLTASEQREQDKFTEEQLQRLEERFIKLQSENEMWQKENKILSLQAKELCLKLEESQREMKQARSEITLLKVELTAYKSLKR
jgi:predicted RNase H-like nuclease (RuvC/YqgF family)